MTAPLTPAQESASAIITKQLTDWGLETLIPDLSALIREGLSADAITLKLQDTDAYKKRFAANTVRIKNGLAALSPAEYIATENSYRQVMQQYGLPSGFWDSADDFADYLGRDVSPAEVNERVKAAQATWLTTDAATKDAWRSFYGLSDSAAIASILDPDRALPIVQRQATAAQIGGAALDNGLGIDRTRFESYADLGLTADQARTGFGQIAATFAGDQRAATRFGTTFDQATAEQATLLKTGAAVKKQSAIADAERALFGARGSADQTSTAIRTSGSY